MNRSDLAFLESMFDCTLAQITAHVLIVNQSAAHTLVSNFEHIKVINSHEYGLSKSRNLALKTATKKLCWFLDDDVIIKKDAIKHIINAFNRTPCYEMRVFKILATTGRDFRDYSSQKLVATHIKDLRHICSIELVVHREAVVASGILFDERLGLGTHLPVGEEFVFAAQLFKAGLVIGFERAVVASHDSYHSGLQVMEENILKARGFIYELTSSKFALFQKLKYLFSLVRHGHIKDMGQLINVWRLLNTVKT